MFSDPQSKYVIRMKYLSAYLLLFFLCNKCVTAQDSLKNNTTENTLRLPLIFWGINYEHSLSKHMTLVGNINFFQSINYSYSSNLGSQFSYPFIPTINIQYRWYYHLKKRAETGKNTMLNSANYITGNYRMSFPKNVYDLVRRPEHTTGIFWGLQRNYQKRLYIDLGVGLVYRAKQSIILSGATWSGSPYFIEDKFSLGSFMNLGLWLNKRKKL